MIADRGWNRWGWNNGWGWGGRGLGLAGFDAVEKLRK
jgi:hypothetical protein